MKTLDQIGVENGTDKSSLHHGYLNYYESLFSKYKQKKITLVEVGVQFGYSINTWLEYFKYALIHGVDIATDYNSNNPRYTFWKGDQRDRGFWSGFVNAIKTVDIVIDDGCHQGDAQKATFECLWPILNPNGIYIVEDWFTTYDPHFKSSMSGTEWLSGVIGDLNWNAKSYYGKPTQEVKVSDYEKSLGEIILRKGLVIIRKA